MTPLSIVQTFVNSADEKNTFAGYLPTFATNMPIKYFELRPVYPRIDKMPYVSAIKLYSATFSVKFWTKANIYAVLMESVNTASTSLSTANQQLSAVRVQSLSSTLLS